MSGMWNTANIHDKNVSVGYYMPRIMFTCPEYFCSTGYKQYHQRYSNHDKIVVWKCIWSYLFQFLTVFNDKKTEIRGNMYKNTRVLTSIVGLFCNRLQPVFLWSLIYSTFEKTLTGTAKNQSFNRPLVRSFAVMVTVWLPVVCGPMEWALKH